MNITELRDTIRTCTDCTLRSKATQPVPWAGRTPAKYLFLGMAPGVTEDKEGEPFIGPAGNLLKMFIRQAGFPSDIAFSNAVRCFPGRVKGGDARPLPAQLAACRQHLQSEIDLIRPKVIFICGKTALEAFRADLELSWVHGKPLYYDGSDFGHEIKHNIGPAGHGRIILWTIYHPAAALRNIKYETMIRNDLDKFWEWTRGGQVWVEGNCYVCGREANHCDHWGFWACDTHVAKQRSLF